jgi:tetratricopeptide (TPR) repeat protein
MVNDFLLSSAHEHHIVGQWQEAISLYKDVLDKDPTQIEAIFALAEIAQKLGQTSTALDLFSEVIKLNPKHSKAYTHRGQLLRISGRPSDAIADFAVAVDLDGQSADVFNSRGIAFAQLEKFECAIDNFSIAINRKRDFADAFYNRALAHRKVGNYDHSISDYSSTIKLKPNHFQAYNNRGFVYRELGRLDDAIVDFKKSSEINPKFHDGFWNASLSLLALGDYENGWNLYEYRWSSASFSSPRRNFSAPLWLGKESLSGKTILLHSEQGFGDSLQFCRYVPLVKEFGCKIILEIETPLMGLMRSISNGIQIVEKDTALPYFDYHCPLMSLPLAFATEIETIPKSDAAYLWVDQNRVKWWKAKLGTKKRPRVGLAWRGNPAHSNDQNRSIPLCNILGELSPDLDWFCLQKDLSSDEERLIKTSTKITHFSDIFTDFADIGALSASLDAILCVDTSIAHLGGALGIPVHVLLPYISDFRWQNEGTSTRWYHSLKLYRQGPDRIWNEPLKNAQAAITEDLLAKNEGFNFAGAT